MPSSSDAVEARRATPGAAWRDGWQRVRRAPALLAGVFAATFLLALPLALVMRSQIETHLGRSAIAAQAADGVSNDWWQEFTSQATGLGTTFTPSVIGFAATLDNVSSVLDARPEILPVASALAVYLAAWTFLTGGILDRYARQRPIRAHGFFGACGGHFFGLVRLGVMAGLVYWWLFLHVHPWLFEDVYPDLTRGLSVERAAFAWRVGFYALFGLLLVLINLWFDYAKVRLVVEDRRSAIGALRAAARFVIRRPRQVLGLYTLNALVFLALIAIWAALAPGVGRGGAWVWLTFAVGQGYLLARLAIKLHFLASATSLFQASLAHATYIAAPAPVWPESPAAEAMAATPPC